MVNILRMDLYRILHGKSFWIFMAIALGLVVISTGVMNMVSNPDFIKSMEAASNSAANLGVQFGMTNSDGSVMDADDYADAAAAAALMSGSTSPMAYYGSFFLGGGGLACLFTIFIAIFFAAEFESGFSKNVFTAQPNRLAVLGIRVAEIVLLAAVFTIVTVAVTLGAAAVTGIDLSPVPLGELALWGGLLVLVLAAFGILTALFVWLTRKMATGIAVAFVLSSGLVTLAIQAVLLLFPGAKHVADFTLSSCMGTLARGLDVAGGLSAVHIAGVGLAFIVVGTVLSAVVLQKKDV